LDLGLMAWMGPWEACDSLIPASSHKIFIRNAFARFYKFFWKKNQQEESLGRHSFHMESMRRKFHLLVLQEGRANALLTMNSCY